MLECATTLCIVSVSIGDSSLLLYKVFAHRGLDGREDEGDTVREKKNNPYFGFLRFVKLQIN